MKCLYPSAVIGAAVLMAGCVSQPPEQPISAAPLPALVFATADSQYRLTAACTRQAKAADDEAGRAFVDVSLRRSPECSEKAADAAFSRVGEYLSVTYVDAADSPHEVTRDTLIASLVDPANALRISVKSGDQAREIAAGLSER